MFNSLQPHGLQHARLFCPSLTPRACSNSCPSSSDAIQPSNLLSSPSPPAFNFSQLRCSKAQRNIESVWNCCRLTVCVPNKIHTLKPNLQWDGIWRWCLGRWLGHESREFTSGISALKKRPNNSLPLLPCWGHSKDCCPQHGRNVSSPDPTSGPWSWTCQPPELWEINVCYLSHSVYGIFGYSSVNGLRQGPCLRVGNQVFQCDVSFLWNHSSVIFIH